MILHLVDDEKFIDATISHFDEIAAQSNLYGLIGNSNKEVPLKHIKKVNRILFIDGIDTTHFCEAIKELNVTSIFIHYLSDIKVKAVLEAKKRFPSLKITWFFWGADGFELDKFNQTLFQPKTRKILPHLKRLKLLHATKEITLSLFFKCGIYFDYINANKRNKLRLIKQLDFIVPVIKQDYELLKTKYNFSAQCLDWNYLSIEQIFSSGIDFKVSGNNILLGNSASATNNHVEMIDLLSTMDLSGRKVIVPLSYGNIRYRDYIIDYGREKLKDSFFPLVDFLPLKEYNELIGSCSSVIMNHNRQQAMGNIIASLWMGAKLYINKETTVFSYLTELGVEFFSIEDSLNFKNLEKSIHNETMELNQKAILAQWSNRRILEKTKHLVALNIN
jgi:dTDP-N-acetylfucosamine:lipid II N-acetylfucosaminyltransferase